MLIFQIRRFKIHAQVCRQLVNVAKFLDNRSHRLGHRRGTRTGIYRRHLYRGRCNIGKLRNGQDFERHNPGQHHEEYQYRSKNRTVDKEF